MDDSVSSISMNSEPRGPPVGQHQGYEVPGNPDAKQALPSVLICAWKCCCCDNITQCKAGSYSVDPANAAQLFQISMPQLRRESRTPSGISVTTVGSQNLVLSRLVPAGWECCLCSTQHFPQTRTNRFAVVVGPMQDADCRSMQDDAYNNRANTTASNSNNTVMNTNSSARRFLHYECLAKHYDTDDTVVVCPGCHVVNKFGEQLGQLDAGLLLAERSRGPLGLHRQWCASQLQRRQMVGAAEEELGETRMQLLGSVALIRIADAVRKARARPPPLPPTLPPPEKGSTEEERNGKMSPRRKNLACGPGFRAGHDHDDDDTVMLDEIHVSTNAGGSSQDEE
ncbi:hypothetical protein B0T26DRAFT_757363 [Lasiosphaeria miniovina]|uniref:Uncharacterized protein n=1 Tax=Lasiosphaeria miniovina TaxID=1954250 RepID=A0AA39ZUN9_9PEZI|nr:uncharacterized protein B0T26DRAFT_757363 [Lasiosphaeria miniovina]KAK0703871.1 hypothetical protein B0T26DRAFT_757363 [Lasiosphaeria miniovina]